MTGWLKVPDERGKGGHARHAIAAQCAQLGKAGLSHSWILGADLAAQPNGSGWVPCCISGALQRGQKGQGVR